MRRAASFGWLTLALLGLLLPGHAWGQYLPLPGPGPIAAAPDSFVSSPVSEETLEPPPPRGYAEDIWKAKRDAASAVSVAPGQVQTDGGASAGAGGVQPLGRSGIPEGAEPGTSAPALLTNFSGINYTGSFPPDPVLAAGPNNLVLVTNGSVTIGDKTGAPVASTSLATFFSSVRALGENAFDPKVVFDTGTSRFFLLAVGRINNSSCTAGTCVSHFFLAVSKTSTPTTTGSGDWFFYGFDATLDGAVPTTNWADYPDLGLDGSVVVLTANMFSFSLGTFQGAKIRILNKSLLIVGGAVAWTDFVGMADPGTGFTSFTLRPALTFGSPGTFFLASKSRTAGSCDIIVWGIANPLVSPTLSALKATAGGTCSTPPDAEQLGGGTPLDTGDTRLINVVYRNGVLWAAHSILMNFGSGNVSAIRWVQIGLGAWPGSVSFIQDSTFGADGIWYFYPTIMVDTSNNLAVVLARSSASEYASTYYTGRLASDPPNTLQPSALLKAGMATQNLIDSKGRNRYGDYLGIGLDPSNGSFWILGEYVVTSTAWGTWVGNFTFPGLALSLNPASFRSGQILTLTATVTPGPTPVTADVYVAVQLPDETLLFLLGDGSITGSLQPIVRNWTISPFSGQIFTYTFGGGEPVGNYAWLAAFTEPGTLNFIGGIVQVPFSFRP